MGTIRRTICLPRDDEDENEENEGDDDDEEEDDDIMMMMMMPILTIMRTNTDGKMRGKILWLKNYT